MFNEHSVGAIAVERSLHEGFLKDLSVTPEVAGATEVSPAGRVAGVKTVSN
jgi:thiaminase (transcriptional activator TenA)